jgi:bifunctional DNase/RNase
MESDMSEMVEVVIDSIRVSLMSPQRVVVLRQRDENKFLPIWVGPYEAEAITIALQEVEVSRPLTQDLLKNVITILGGNVLRVEVVALRNDTFYGNVVVEQNGQIHDIDARPSDAIALAVRVHAPILVHQAVLEAASITPEEDIQEGLTAPASHSPAADTPPVPADEERLDVFEDFLKNIGGSSGEDNPKDKPKDKPKE